MLGPRVRIPASPKRPRGSNRARAAFFFTLLVLAGCRGPRSSAEHIELASNPLRDARAGELCRYESLRDAREPGEPPIREEWTLLVRTIGGGAARLEVTVLGPPRKPPSPSPREPGYELFMPMKDEGFTGTQILRLFHRPELSNRGMRAVLDRDVASVSGGVRTFPLVVQGKTCNAHEMELTIEDETLLRGHYRLVIVDEIPACGIWEAELDEVWKGVTSEGEPREERRHEILRLVETRS